MALESVVSSLVVLFGESLMAEAGDVDATDGDNKSFEDKEVTGGVSIDLLLPRLNKGFTVLDDSGRLGGRPPLLNAGEGGNATGSITVAPLRLKATLLS